MEYKGSNWEKLRLAIEETYNLNELQGLAYDLSINFEQLSEGPLTSKVISLIDHVCRHGRIKQLKQKLKEDRSSIDWDQIDWSKVTPYRSEENTMSAEPHVITKFSASFSESFEKLFRAGGFMLVFIFSGVILMIIGYINPSSNLSNWIFGIGALITIACLFLFFYLQLKGPVQASRILRENGELLDTIQDISIGLTDTISRLQSLMFKHSEQIARIIDLGAPLLVQLPVLDELTLAETKDISSWIVKTTETSQDIIADIRHSLINADSTNLKKYSNDLERVALSFRDALSKQNNLTERIPDYKQQIQNLEDQLTSVVITLSAIQKSVLSYADYVNGILNTVSQLQSVPVVGSALNRLDVPKLKILSEEAKALLIKSSDVTESLKTNLEINDNPSVIEKLIELREIGIELDQLLNRSNKS